ncbi:hypothetical protein AGMMS49992_25220 [Clostridia bacterium]|nr:hypothetical protein AGMMS49992_25220 [Clostridia bacterium]
MSEIQHISDLKLERYKLGELPAEDTKMIDSALEVDSSLADRLDKIRESDRDILSRFPAEKVLGGIRKRKPVSRRIVWGLCAAALLMCLAIPAFYFVRDRYAPALTDRAKGGALSSHDMELKAFLKENFSTRNLEDRSVLGAGSTIQLAYNVPAGEYFGVIFSIDGRAVVTLHYPYKEDMSSHLVTGKQVLLDEAYTLDDAPLFECFFLVTGEKPLDTNTILGYAGKLAAQNRSPGDPQGIIDEGAGIFKGYRLDTLTVIKK